MSVTPHAPAQPSCACFRPSTSAYNFGTLKRPCLTKMSAPRVIPYHSISTSSASLRACSSRTAWRFQHDSRT
eukprot:scaffold13644_cov66-Phaeocystis_antarctica.AAC.4